MKKTFRKPFLISLAILAAACPFLSGQGKPGSSSLPFNPQDGETVVFLGDSITHQCLYTQYLENFFITRYPERRIRFVNAGVAGDAAEDVLARFIHDVGAHKPDYVTILLGMNDGRYEEFDREIFNVFRHGMTKLLDKIEALGARAVVLSPTMFDHAVVERRQNDGKWRFREKEFPPNYNALMSFYGGWALEEAGKRNVPFVGLWGPLNRHTIDQRRTKQNFTLIGDAIHPQASGQFVMAFEILSQLGVERRGASSITVTKRGNRWAGAKGIEDLEVNESATEVRFKHRANSIPWVIPEKHATKELRWLLPPDGRVGYAITNAGHKLSADRVKITGLAPGNYEVSIDGQVIGTWNHIALGTKIEIQENEKTPQYQQALKVAEMNRKRTDEFVRPARDIGGRIKQLRKKVDAQGPVKLEKAIGVTKKEERTRVALLDMMEEQEAMAKLNQKADAMLEEIYKAAQPVTREWIIRRVGAPTAGRRKN